MKLQLASKMLWSSCPRSETELRELQGCAKRRDSPGSMFSVLLCCPAVLRCVSHCISCWQNAHEVAILFYALVLLFLHTTITLLRCWRPCVQQLFEKKAALSLKGKVAPLCPSGRSVPAVHGSAAVLWGDVSVLFQRCNLDLSETE